MKLVAFVVAITVSFLAFNLKTDADVVKNENVPKWSRSAVIHHTASPDWSVDRFRQIHVNERGWDDVGYHYIIRKDGRIEAGRPTWKQGAHAKGRNNMLGIALTGYDAFTDAQISGLRKLIKKHKIRHIERHHGQCPGPGLNGRGIEWK